MRGSRWWRALPSALLIDVCGRRAMLAVPTAGMAVAAAVLGSAFAFWPWPRAMPWVVSVGLALYVGLSELGP
jgi:hypothetical protein